MKYRVHHCHLICSDLEQMITFMTETLGADLVERRKFGAADGATLDLAGNRINLRVARDDETVVGDASETRYGYDHLGLEVDDVDRAFDDLTAKGYKFTVTPRDADPWRIAFFKGPDNITIELVQVLQFS